MKEAGLGSVEPLAIWSGASPHRVVQTWVSQDTHVLCTWRGEPCFQSSVLYLFSIHSGWVVAMGCQFYPWLNSCVWWPQAALAIPPPDTPDQIWSRLQLERSEGLTSYAKGNFPVVPLVQQAVLRANTRARIEAMYCRNVLSSLTNHAEQSPEDASSRLCSTRLLTRPVPVPPPSRCTVQQQPVHTFICAEKCQCK